jgi:hypothetical protein
LGNCVRIRVDAEAPPNGGHKEGLNGKWGWYR